MSGDIAAYARQGFGADLQPQAPYGLLIVDLVNGFADPAVFGGGNIPQAIANTERLWRRRGHGAGRWRQPHRVFRQRRGPQHLHPEGAGHADAEGGGLEQRDRAELAPGTTSWW